MFGYVRPLQPELKCKEFDLYRATYCGLCRCMRRRYGLIAPMFLNFDFTFLEQAADESVVLAWWKLRDDLGDEGVGKRLAVQALSWMLRPAYQKAARRRPGFDETVRTCLKELAGLEQENCPSLDQTADTFARLLQSADRKSVV